MGQPLNPVKNKHASIALYNKLREKSKLVEWHNAKRREYFALFSKARFTPELKNENVILFDLKDMEKHLNSY